MGRQEGFGGMESTAMSLPGPAGGSVASSTAWGWIQPRGWDRSEEKALGVQSSFLMTHCMSRARSCLCATSLELGFMLGWYFASSLGVFLCHIKLPFGS